MRGVVADVITPHVWQSSSSILMSVSAGRVSTSFAAAAAAAAFVHWWLHWVRVQ
jgi:hypothetical protein